MIKAHLTLSLTLGISVAASMHDHNSIPLQELMTSNKKESVDLFSSIDIRSVLTRFGDNQSSMFMIKDRLHRFQYVNARFADMVGCNAADVIGKDDIELGCPAELLFGNPEAGIPGVRILDEEAMSTGESSCTMGDPVDLGNGIFDSSETIRTPLKNDSGDVIGLVIQCKDETYVNRLEQQVQSTNKTLNSLDEDLVALDSILADLMSCREVETLLNKITDTVVARTVADGAYIASINESSDRVVGMAATGKWSEDFLGMNWRSGEGIIGKAWSTSSPILVDDADGLGSSIALGEQTQLAALPIKSHGRVVAIMAVASHREEFNLADELPGLTRFIGMAGIAIANAQLLSAMAANLAQTRALSEVSRQLAVVDDLNAACSTVCRMMLSAVDVVRASSVVIDNNGDLAKNAVWKLLDGKPQAAEAMPLELLQESAIHWCLTHAEHAVVSHEKNDPRESDSVRDTRLSMNVGSTCFVPYFKHEKAIGVMMISSDRSHPQLDETTVELFRSVVNQLTTAIERQALSEALHEQAFHDQLTGLSNRHAFEQELDRLLTQSASNVANGAVLYIDLDGFKEVNDSMGHAIGDRLLCEVADRLSATLDTSCEFLARMGGDEFAIVLRNDKSVDDYKIGHRILETLSRPFIIETTELRIGASIGLSRFPNDGNTVDELLRNADIAMYQGKQTGKGQLRYFDESVAKDVKRRSQLQAGLRVALKKQQFELHYQPQICCATGRVLGMEALLRWHLPGQGYISPGEFIPVAEESGLIDSIGTWVLDNAIAQLAAWQGDVLGDLRVSVNIASSQFQNEDFVTLVTDSITRHGAEPALLELEVTESVVMKNVSKVIDRLNELRSAGIRIAIDDFGTGYSSLSYLQDLPLDVLKIDRAFVTRLQNESAENSLANTIVLLASRFGLETVAEGVETEEEFKAIVSLGCNMIQGFYYSKPLPPAKLYDAIAAINNQSLDNGDIAA